MIVTTIHGDMDESLLEKQTGVNETSGEYTAWTEYYLNSELVHRSVHVTMKEGSVTASAIGDFNG